MKETNSDASAAYAALRGGEGPRPPPVGSEDEQTPHMHSAMPNWQSGTPVSSHPGQAASPAVPFSSSQSFPCQTAGAISRDSATVRIWSAKPSLSVPTSR